MAITQDIQNRVDAYMGNPGALMQRYQQNQQLIDLLALQKIKSEKEAAARQMQMQMAQQQAASGEAPMTVAQQREKEVMELTKNELADQRGKLLQQQQGEQQAAMQKLLSGIASAPGAQSAAAPQAMAAGGIVAFNGETGSSVDSGLTQAEQEYKKALDTFRRFGGAQRQRDPEGFANAQQSLEEARQRRDALMSSWQEEQGGANRAVPGRATGAALAQPPVGIAAIPAPAAPAPAAPAGEYRDEGLGGRRGGLPSPAAAAAVPARADNVLSPRRTGIASVLPSAPSTASAAPVTAAPSAEQDPIKEALSREILGALQQRPEEAQGAEFMRAQGILGMSPEQKTTIERNRAALAARYAQQEAARRERMPYEVLAGMAPSSTGLGALASAGRSASAAQSAEETRRLAQMKELQGLEEGLFEKERGIRGEAFKASQEAAKRAGETQRQGLASGASLYSTIQKSIDDAKKLAQEGDIAKLNIELKKKEIEAQQANAKAMRDGTEQTRLLANISALERDVTRNTVAIMNKYQPQIDMARQMLKPGDKAGEQKLRDMITERDAAIAQATDNLIKQRQLVESAMGFRGAPAGSTGSMRVVEEK